MLCLNILKYVEDISKLYLKYALIQEKCYKSKFIKKEYKKVTGDTLTLTEDGELEAIVQNTSRVRHHCHGAALRGT